MQFTTDDIRSAVATGIVTEAQAASILALAAARAGQRDALQPDEEPFEFFRGFAEIFVSVGLLLLISGVLALTQVYGGPLTSGIAALLCWTFANYFTRKRRMALPSIILVAGFYLGAAVSIALILRLVMPEWEEDRTLLALFFVLVLVALGVWYRTFRVPFTMFLAGLTMMGLIFTLTDSMIPLANGVSSWSSVFDLRQGSGFALGTLIFGVAAFMAGLFFDMRDPFRLSRWSACGFWLHILAAPALVNTVALTAYNSGDLLGKVLLAVTLLIVALLALIIDRRSFLTAGVLYLGLLVAWVLRSGVDPAPMALVLLVLGIILTGMGTFWTQMRGYVMRTLPHFPGKTRLPPYVLIE